MALRYIEINFEVLLSQVLHKSCSSVFMGESENIQCKPFYV